MYDRNIRSAELVRKPSKIGTQNANTRRSQTSVRKSISELSVNKQRQNFANIDNIKTVIENIQISDNQVRNCYFIIINFQLILLISIFN